MHFSRSGLDHFSVVNKRLQVCICSWTFVTWGWTMLLVLNKKFCYLLLGPSTSEVSHGPNARYHILLQQAEVIDSRELGQQAEVELQSLGPVGFRRCHVFFLFLVGFFRETKRNKTKERPPPPKKANIQRKWSLENSWVFGNYGGCPKHCKGTRDTLKFLMVCG